MPPFLTCSYSLIATNPSMSQELEYGDRECEVKPENVTDLEDYLQQEGSNESASDFCYYNSEL